MQLETCGLCDEGWICEVHPHLYWPHPDENDPEGECAGPGMPCPNGCLKLDASGIPVLPEGFTEVWRKP